jgi:hypothetical protein
VAPVGREGERNGTRQYRRPLAEPAASVAVTQETTDEAHDLDRRCGRGAGPGEVSMSDEEKRAKLIALARTAFSRLYPRRLEMATALPQAG